MKKPIYSFGSDSLIPGYVWRPFSKCVLLALALLFLAGSSRVYAQCDVVFTTGCWMGHDIHTFTLPGEGATSISSIASNCYSPGSWANYTNDSVTMNPGSSYTATINTQASGVSVQAFIDFDDDNSFSMSESVGGLASVQMDPMTSTFSIAIPPGSVSGAHFMRVIARGDASYPMIPSCIVPPTSTFWGTGEVHDYIAVIGGSTAPSCPYVTGLTASSITSTSAVISWTAATGSVGYRYINNTSSAGPTTSGTPTLTTSYTATGLTPATTYYAHVRDSCGPTSLSAWATYSFTTTSSSGGCAAVTGLTASGVTNTSANISWTAVTGSVGYKYVINTTAADPTVPGTLTTSTSTSPASLTPSTVYYAHVRDSCGAANVSAWVTISFTTTATAPSCLPVSSLASSSVTGSSATISWASVTGSTGYKYVVNTTAADPTVAGTFTVSTSANLTGLSSGTTYYAHVRDSCGVGNVSSWVTISFTTTGVAGVTETETNAGSFISVHPNPVTGIANITVKGQTKGVAKIHVLDISGRVIRVVDVVSGSVSVDLSSVPAGVYVCRYADVERTEIVRVVKE